MLLYLSVHRKQKSSRNSQAEMPDIGLAEYVPFHAYRPDAQCTTETGADNRD
jgi:hypothetical protein